MTPQQLLALMTCLFMATNLLAADPQPVSTPQQSILEIAIGKPVEVRLKTGDKLRGRLEAVRDTSFDLTVAAKDRLETRTVAYIDVKSLKERKPVGGGKIAVGILAGFGVCAIVLMILAAAIQWD